MVPPCLVLEEVSARAGVVLDPATVPSSDGREVVEVAVPDLEREVQERARALAVPGVAVAVTAGARTEYAFAGVTNVDHPLAVDASTLFQIGSTGKTYTATVLMMPADQWRVDPAAPVRTYLPDFRAKGEDVARRITVLQPLNHTAG